MTDEECQSLRNVVYCRISINSNLRELETFFGLGNARIAEGKHKTFDAYEVVRIRSGLKLNYILLYKLLFPHRFIICFRRNHWLFHVLWHCATLDNWKSHCCTIESKHGKQSLYATINIKAEGFESKKNEI